MTDKELVARAIDAKDKAWAPYSNFHVGAAILCENGDVFTAHTTNPVPFCVVNYPCALREGGVLADIAPTMIQIMGQKQPKEMDGKSLITFACHNC